MALQTFFDDSRHGRRWKETGSIERKDGSGRPKGSKPTQDAMLEKLCLADRKASTAELTVKWRKRTRGRVDLHPSTVNLRLLEMNLPARTPRRKPLKTETPMAGIIEVAKVWRAITPEYLENLYEIMPRRMAAVVAAGGRHTKY